MSHEPSHDASLFWTTVNSKYLKISSVTVRVWTSNFQDLKVQINCVHVPWNNRNTPEFCCYKYEELQLKELSIWEGRSLESSGFGCGKLLNDKVLYLELDKGRLQPPAESNAVTEDERHPLLPAQIQQGSLSTKQLLLAFCIRRKKQKKKKNRLSYGCLTLLWAYYAVVWCAVVDFTGCMRSI